MNDKELEGLVSVCLLRNELLSVEVSLEEKISFYERIFETLTKILDNREKRQKKLFCFLRTLEEIGPAAGSTLIFREIKDDAIWMKTLEPFFLLGGVNVKIIKTFLSVNSREKKENLAVLEEINSVLMNLKMIREKDNN